MRQIDANLLNVYFFPNVLCLQITYGRFKLVKDFLWFFIYLVNFKIKESVR